jgi:hypothetical protein
MATIPSHRIGTIDPTAIRIYAAAAIHPIQA